MPLVHKLAAHPHTSTASVRSHTAQTEQKKPLRRAETHKYQVAVQLDNNRTSQSSVVESESPPWSTSHTLLKEDGLVAG
jgi:hypothetical protein